MSNHSSKVNVTLVLKNVPVHTDSHPEDITVAAWKQILMDLVENHIKEHGLASVAIICDYNIIDTQFNKE